MTNKFFEYYSSAIESLERTKKAKKRKFLAIILWSGLVLFFLYYFLQAR